MSGTGLPQQTHLAMHGMEQAWKSAEGWSLIGVLDGGIDPEHPSLRSFTGPDSIGGSLVPGGNYIAYGSYNAASEWNLQLSNVVRDWLAQPVDASTEPCDGLDGTLDSQLTNLSAGHGTHVAGLIGANPQTGTGIRGTCVACGMQFARLGRWICDLSEGEAPELSYTMAELPAGLGGLMRNGMQVANHSGGLDGYCLQYSCTESLDLLKERDVILVASAGNTLGFPYGVQWPARMTDVLAAGGLNPARQMWDQSPNACPYDPVVPTPDPGENWCLTPPGVPYPGAPDQNVFNYIECGSNHRRPNPFSPYSCLPGSTLELMALAQGAWSLFPYPPDEDNFPEGVTWNGFVDCGDRFGPGTARDGIGPCTGTSMSAPILSGIVGLLRSINPLMPAGNPFEPSADPFSRAPAAPGVDPFNRNIYGIRDLLAQVSGSGVADDKLGFGIPSAAVAVSEMLGTSRYEAVVNRVTPLFALYSPLRKDYAAVATPQMAMELAYDRNQPYRMGRLSDDTFIEGQAVPGYPHLPNAYDKLYPPEQAVKAAALILTTHVSPDASYPAVIPLFLMERPAPKGSPQLHDSILLSSVAQVEAAAALGYRYLGRQGYLYEWCETAGCAPPGTEAPHLLCNANNKVQDCAVFLDSQASVFTSAGYNALFPGATRSQLGLAYTLADADGDLLVDALERLIGTSTQHADSDGDGASDALEYPLATAPFTDPCDSDGPSNFCVRADPRMFRNGFETGGAP